jgi:hypothetical protein
MEIDSRIGKGSRGKDIKERGTRNFFKGNIIKMKRKSLWRKHCSTRGDYKRKNEEAEAGRAGQRETGRQTVHLLKKRARPGSMM